MNELGQLEQAIFEAALELPPEQWAAHVRRACGDNALLRKGVEALLQAHEQTGGPLERPAIVRQETDAGGGSAQSEQPGGRIGRYKLLQQIGEGGCGVVYMAEQEEPVRRRVALKVIKLGMDTKQVVGRFEAERQALALMEHPNIAKVLDAGATATGRPFFVMELVRGVKITEFCDQHRVSTEARLKLFIQVCNAVQHAHQKGIIHRDLKPSNILVTLNDGVAVPKVIDFGIAKATQGRLTARTVFTAFEQFIGTPAYMSPEQAVMTSLDADTRTDIYSLGVLLYEVLTGRTPFDGKQMLADGLDAMRKTIREIEPPRPSTRLSTMAADTLTTMAGNRQTDAPSLVRLIRGDLDWIVMKCLEKDRSLRYATANGLAMDLQRYLDNEPIAARPPSRLYRLRKMARRNKATLASALALALALVMALGILIVSNLRTIRERNQKDQALKERGAALERARDSEREAKQHLFEALRSQAQARRYSRQVGQRLGSLAALTEAARIRPEEGLRDDAIAAMALPDIRFGPTWRAVGPETKAAAFEPSYRRYARVEADGFISVRSVPEGREVQRFRSGLRSAVNMGLWFSPDGSLLAGLDDNGKLRVWCLEDGRPVLLDGPQNCEGLAFSSDSRHLLVGQEDWIIHFDMPNGIERSRMKARARVHALALDPSYHRLAVGYSSSAQVSVYAVADGSSLTELPVGPSRDQVVAWHPDGKRLAVASSDPRIQIWDVETKTRVAMLEGHVQQVTLLSFHRDGELLASSSWESMVRLWDPSSARQVMQIASAAVTAQFSDDGKWLGVAWHNQGDAQLLQVTPSHEYHTLVSSLGAGQGIYYQGDVSPDGRLLAMGMEDGVRLWDLSTSREISFLPLGETLSLFFQPGGHELVTCGPESGLQRWALQQDAEVRGEIHLGPPRKIQLPFAPTRVSRSRDGQTAAVVAEEAGESLLVDLAAGSVRLRGFPHEDGGFLALSPDARWLATAGWHSPAVKLWNARSGQLAQEWALQDPRAVSFTPDNRELIIAAGDEFVFRNLEDLQVSRRFQREVRLYPGHIAFSRDAKMMALEMAPGIIHLKEVATGRTVAKLEDPAGDSPTWMAFSVSGTRLIVAARYAAAIHIWDLQAIRAQLKTMSLDWDWPEFPGSDEAAKPRFPITQPSIKVQVIRAGAG